MVSCPFLHICLRSKEDTTLCIQRPYPPIRDSMPTAWASGPPDHDAAGLIVVVYPHTIWGRPDAGTQAAVIAVIKVASS